MDSKLLDNIKQQAKRLLEQLKDLEEYKDDLGPEEYQTMKADTIQQLEIFQSKLVEFESGDLSLKSDIQKQQDLIRDAVKQSFNSEDIRTMMSSSQSNGIREKIKKLEQDHSLNRINNAQYTKEVLQCINQLIDMGIQLAPNEKEFLSVNTGKDNFVVQENDVQGKQLLKSAGQQLATQLK